MAKRMIFSSKTDYIGVTISEITFDFFTGFAISQKQKSVKSLHENARKSGYKQILEVSTKSIDEIGIALSAFNLSTRTKKNNYEFTVERAFQASKVFENGGPYTEILNMSSIEAKKDIRLRNSGEILYFKFFNYIFEKNPPTYFYDWLYINTLIENVDLINKLDPYDAFTDIEFNHKRSINCQAYSLALFCSMIKNDIEFEKLKDPKYFLKICSKEYQNRWGEKIKIKESNNLELF